MDEYNPLLQMTEEEKKDLEDAMKKPGSADSASGNEIALDDLARGMGGDGTAYEERNFVGGNDTVH